MTLPIHALLLSTVSASAQVAPIEPALVPVVNKDQQIDLQMGKYEITVAEFSRFVEATGYQVPKKCMLFTSTRWPDPDSPGNWDNAELTRNPYRPVVCVGIPGAMAYAQWLSEQTGKPYRLPTLQEWQLAASAQTTSRSPFGEDWQQTQICKYENTEDLANLAGMQIDHQHRYSTSANCNDGAVYHTVIGMYRPNPLGLHDMMGNVKELLQSCQRWDDKNPKQCTHYDVAGEGWHWQTRGVFNADTIAADFYGSIEGFRLVLEQPAKEGETPYNSVFARELADAQRQQRLVHQQLGQLPPAPTGVRAARNHNNQVTISWQGLANQSARYSVYRSYVDPNGQLSRKQTLVAKDLTAEQFTDQLPGAGQASYTVAATTSPGQGPFSISVETGHHVTFKPGQRIEAEHYVTQEQVYLIDHKEKNQQSLAFNDNPYHYPTGDKPLLPAWSSYQFESPKQQDVELQMRLRADEGTQIEIWQGHHLVARIADIVPDTLDIIKVPAKLIASDAPIEVRAGTQTWFIVDWLQFNPLAGSAQ